MHDENFTRKGPRRPFWAFGLLNEFGQAIAMSIFLILRLKFLHVDVVEFGLVGAELCSI